ncbi:hypothetical protein MM1S1530915_2395 [Mycobacteroides abscessus subsp. bolletii 1S-153-0915]|uniref:Uncharacterized protein n=1 Tax=Mycobacteroides abscessus MAB_091912_2446 TaxID=1335414 RepID=A0A829MI61_9MYCO|nr:hypothetical protein MM1S1530915_2395 [Mycobacteroides abscessus subsp. bolletii 1S-153-0915]EIU83543.1 hypothetical protein MM2B0626_2772 [Mycobacteroides abscessus subsp. bolletii 2B-0626]ESV59294.1 hypothetical protein L830_1508 [Mycobacteroides abscessus MAB_082312_2258]ESV64106.1 hypothetical protein L833_1490 [Mycobacteroides abscessus MAB_091912_2446]ETZ82477.1 hypothetical protein L834_2709 [Mycobacteroides abscessus MAB_091912_2455]
MSTMPTGISIGYLCPSSAAVCARSLPSEGFSCLNLPQSIEY